MIFIFPDIFHSLVLSCRFHFIIYFVPYFGCAFPPRASHPHSESISSAPLDIRRAQQKARSRPTRNPLVWRRIAVFIIIPKSMFNYAMTPPLALCHSFGSFRWSLGLLPSCPSGRPCKLDGWSKERLKMPEKGQENRRRRCKKRKAANYEAGKEGRSGGEGGWEKKGFRS